MRKSNKDLWKTLNSLHFPSLRTAGLLPLELTSLEPDSSRDQAIHRQFMINCSLNIATECVFNQLSPETIKLPKDINTQAF